MAEALSAQTLVGLAGLVAGTLSSSPQARLRSARHRCPAAAAPLGLWAAVPAVQVWTWSSWRSTSRPTRPTPSTRRRSPDALPGQRHRRHRQRRGHRPRHAVPHHAGPARAPARLRPPVPGLRAAADRNHMVMGQTRPLATCQALCRAGAACAARTISARSTTSSMTTMSCASTGAPSRTRAAARPRPSASNSPNGPASSRRRPTSSSTTTPAPATPVYSMADLFACAQAGKTDYFKRAAGKVVLFGEVVDIEDRHEGAKRFEWNEAASARAAPARCVLAADPKRFAAVVDRKSMPGVEIQRRGDHHAHRYYRPARDAGPGCSPWWRSRQPSCRCSSCSCRR